MILGLLVGGILAGQSLIRASEMRAVTSEYQRYVIATRAFRDKYFAIPGDMANAISFWGAVNTGGAAGNCTTPETDVGTGTQTCNGTGNHVIGDRATVARQLNEVFRYWQHLANAGLIEGSYTGIGFVTGSGIRSTAGENVPASRATQACWGVDTPRFPSLDGSGIQYGHRLTIGAQHPFYDCSQPAFIPSEVWNIDTKMDDGRPRAGKVMTFGTNCTSSATISDLTADYALSATGKTCNIHFPQAF